MLRIFAALLLCAAAIPAQTPAPRLDEIVSTAWKTSGAPSVFDYPLSTRFDESDAVLVFDRVFVPWERVFVYRDVALTAAQFYETPAHLFGNHQAQVRCVGCGNTFTVGSTAESIQVEVCNKCHPFFTGTQNIVDTAGQVERFQKRLERSLR